MFTGLIEEVAVVRTIEHGRHSAQLKVGAKRVVEGIQLGDSIAVNGVCLTVVRFRDEEFVADAVPETLRRTNLGTLRPGQRVNVERALRLGDRLGGHVVSGHVDGVGVIRDVRNEDIATVITVEAPADVMRYVVDKGSICIDGTSLTVMDTAPSVFRVSVIPHTAANTTLTHIRAGEVVNLECDILAKYIEKMVLDRDSAGGASGAYRSTDRQSNMNFRFLQEHGFA